MTRVQTNFEQSTCSLRKKIHNMNVKLMIFEIKSNPEITDILQTTERAIGIQFNQYIFPNLFLSV